MMTPVAGRFPEMVQAARTYCGLIDRLDTIGGEHLVEAASRLLPRLHAAVASLPVGERAAAAVPLVDIETRFALYRRIRRKLGQRDAYWLEYDQLPLEEEMSGSLADDLTDIYFDLRRGLQLLDEDSPVAPVRAARDWRTSYREHWGEHLVDAERHVFHLLRAHGA